MSDKNDILNLALNELLNIYLEGCVINKDFYGYWRLLEEELFGVSILSFKYGINNFYNAIKQSENSDLINYDIKLRIRLCNSEFIRAAANEVCHTFENTVTSTLDENARFDFVPDDLSKFERILFLFFVYHDKIQLSALAERRAMEPPERRRFSVNH